MRKTVLVSLMVLLLSAVAASAQTDRREVRQGNRKFKKEDYRSAEVDYRRALLKDSTSLAARYNLGSALYRQENYEGASETMKNFGEGELPADVHYNAGDVALQLKDYATAVEEFKRSLLLNPDDMEAKENYTYAKMMLENEQNGGGGGGGDQNQDDNQDQNNDNQSDNNDQPGDNEQNDNGDNQDNGQDNNNGQQPQQSEGGISPQQAQQILNAIQAQEQKTQDKVNKEKAAALKSRQKEKNW